MCKMDLDSYQGGRPSLEVSASGPYFSAKYQCNVVIRDKVFAKEMYGWLQKTAPWGLIEKSVFDNPFYLCNQLIFIHLL